MASVTRCTFALACLLLLLLPRALDAQRISATLDMGGASLQYADSVRATAFSISPAASLEWSAASMDGNGTVSQLGSGWSANGALGASIYTPSVSVFAGEVSGTGGGSAHEDGTRTGEIVGRARLHVMGTAAGAWAGAGVGQSSDGSRTRSLRQLEAGAWATIQRTTAMLALTPVAVDDTLRYVDTQLSIAWATPRLQLSAGAGLRTGDELPSFAGNSRSWGSVNLAVSLKPWLALVGSGGTYPVDLTQGYPGGRFATLGVRLRTGAISREQPVATGTAPAPIEPSRVADANDLEFQLAGAGPQRTVRVRAPNAQSVEISADFTSWEPVRLTRVQGGWWAVTLPIARGTFEMNLRVNGGPWMSPPGLTAVTDEFGGVVGIISVD